MLRPSARTLLAALLACLGLALTATSLPASGAISATRTSVDRVGSVDRIDSADRVDRIDHSAQSSGGTTPGVDPGFIYSQLAHMVTRFQSREAGYRQGSAGHTGFARYWTQQMLHLLGSFGASARNYPFRIRGWLGRPATAPASNVEITVPGLRKPAQEVIIGCHYDGEADSTQSAYDDGSGCAIELGVAQAMAAFWRAHHLYPARTLRFVLFDAEEQGLLGSYEYVNQVARNDLRIITTMINEEQNGIAYPLRYLGKSSNPQMPFFAYLSPLSSNTIYPQRTT